MSREGILLKEYETCQAECGGSARNFWTTFGFFVSFSTAVMGAIIALAVQKQVITRINPLWLGLLLVFCVIVLVVLFFLKSWLKRVNHFIGINNARMREIERELGMETKQLIWALDKWKMPGKNEKEAEYRKLRDKITQSLVPLSPEEKQKIADRRERLPDDYEPPGNAKQLFFSRLFCPLVSVWVILAACIVVLLFYKWILLIVHLLWLL